MTIERRRRDFPLAPSTLGRRPALSAWWLRLRLRSVEHHINRLERQLADEFATVETSPLINEHRELLAKRDELQRRLAGEA